MIRKMLKLALVMGLAWATGARAAAPIPEATCFDPGKNFDARFVGNWEVAEWKLRYSIRMKGKQVCLYARDAQHDEWFEIPELGWDGKTLSVSFLMPSTQWRTQSRLTLIDGNRLRDESSSKEGPQIDTWTRRQ